MPPQVKFQNVLMLLRDIPSAVKFYGPDGLGLKITGAAASWAVLETEGIKLSFQQVEGEASVTTGYTPFLNFSVTDLDSTMMKLLMLGAKLDGPVKYPVHGKVASLRAPDGHMIGLFEPSAHIKQGS